jgi:hypothetical protein
MSNINESLTRWNKSEPFELQAARGQIRNHYVVHIFGYNPDVDSAAEETIWTAGGLYDHANTPVVMTVSSTSASDTAAGVGARQIYILGINSTGGEVSETVILNGQTGVNTTHTYTEIQYALVTSVGSSAHNVGSISIGTGTITGGIPANKYGHILANENASLMGHYTVPAGFTGYITKGSISTGSTQAGKNITGRLKYRSSNDIIHTAAIVVLTAGSVDFDFTYPVKVDEKSCISATAQSTTNDERVSCYFQLVLIKNQD